MPGLLRNVPPMAKDTRAAPERRAWFHQMMNRVEVIKPIQTPDSFPPADAR